MSNISADLYVSPSGDDRWSGTLPEPNATKTDGPLASLERARKAVRSIKSEEKPVRVLLRGGTYELSDVVHFGTPDSGTEQASITYAAYDGETPILSGGRRITGWTNVEANRWEVHLPEVAAGQWRFRELYIDGEPRPRASLPRSGFFRVAEPIEAAPTDTVFDRFVYARGDLKPWKDLPDIDLVAFIKWRAPKFRIASIDEKTQTVQLTGGMPTRAWWAAFKAGNRYRVENVREGLTDPGQWHLDFTTGVLTYLAKEGEDPNQLQVIAPRLNTLIHIGGELDQCSRMEPVTGPHEIEQVEYIRFDGITFAHTNWHMPDEGTQDAQAAIFQRAAIEADGAHHCRIERCTITCTGGYGIHFAAACKHNVIAHNELTILGAGGIKLGEQRLRLTEPEISAHNQIDHNHIHHGGLVHQAGVGIWIGQTFDNSVRHNHIHHLYYTGISVGWVWGYGPSNTRQIAVEFNHIHHIGMGLLEDMGGIYTLGVQPETRLRHNHIHHIECHAPDDGGYGGWGIYPDEGSSYILIENNLCHHTTDGGFHQHYGRENRVRNNIFAMGRYTQAQCTRREAHISYFFERNVVLAIAGLLLGKRDGGGWHDDRIVTSNNLYWRTDGKDVVFPDDQTLTKRQAAGFETGSIIAEPAFKNVEAADFRLSENEALSKIGFRLFEVPTLDADC